MSTILSRRGFLGAAGAGLALPRIQAANGFRFVHLTDFHYLEDRRAGEGMARCLDAVNKLSPQPDFIMTGGDLVNDVLAADRASADSDFAEFLKILKGETDLPVRHCIGNHDVFGWQRTEEAIRRDPLYGKKKALEVLELDRSYYRFDHKGWRFFVLDDIQYSEEFRGRYAAFLDEEQMGWFEAELAGTPPDTPAAVISHIPIITATVFNKAFRRGSGFFVGDYVICQDSERLTALLSKHKVRLALSGHIHQLDKLLYRDVTYICDGAVSGSWWRGDHHGTEEGFGVLDLEGWGGFEHRYFDYGWTAG